MNYEAEAVEMLRRTSVLEVLCIQRDMFLESTGQEPFLFQLPHTLRPSLAKELAQTTGVPLDTILEINYWQFGTSIIQFRQMYSGEYLRIYGKNTLGVTL